MNPSLQVEKKTRSSLVPRYLSKSQNPTMLKSHLISLYSWEICGPGLAVCCEGFLGAGGAHCLHSKTIKNFFKKQEDPRSILNRG